MTNSIRPLSAHTPHSLILAPDLAQKSSPQINVQLMDDQEVFGQPVARGAHSALPPWRLAAAAFVQLFDFSSFSYKVLK
jgi:hypothetical protein